MLHPLRWNKVSKPDRGQCNKTKIRRIQVVPSFPAGKEEGSKKYIAEHQHYTQPNWYGAIFGYVITAVYDVVLDNIIFPVISSYLQSIVKNYFHSF